MKIKYLENLFFSNNNNKKKIIILKDKSYRRCLSLILHAYNIKICTLLLL